MKISSEGIVPATISAILKTTRIDHLKISCCQFAHLCKFQFFAIIVKKKGTKKCNGIETIDQTVHLDEKKQTAVGCDQGSRRNVKCRMKNQIKHPFKVRVQQDLQHSFVIELFICFVPLI